jgi:hypothetical protein
MRLDRYADCSPELDIWCIGLTILTLLLGRKYPIGTSHKDIGLMKYSVQLCLHEVDQLYPPLSVEGQPEDVDDWIQFRRALEGFLTIDGVQRMRNFEGYQLGPQMNRSLSVFAKSAGSRTCESSCQHETGSRTDRLGPSLQSRAYSFTQQKSSIPSLYTSRPFQSHPRRPQSRCIITSGCPPKRCCHISSTCYGQM